MASQVTTAGVQVSPEVCPSPEDTAYVNFNQSQLSDPEGFHGMLFFGVGDTFYISHLPMFHAPHDYQAIVEVRLSPEAKARYQAAQSSGRLFTFSPGGNFVLPRQITGLTPISGTLFNGHFERGGTELVQTELQLVRVVFYKKLSLRPPANAPERQVIFGNGDEYFIAREVSRRPGVDEIIPLPRRARLPENIRAEIARNGQAFTNTVSVSGRQVSVGEGANRASFPYQELYRETGDLQ